MRKVRRKRVAALTLALALLASSGGVCSAAAAEPGSTGLEVTLVPLDDTGSGAPLPESPSPAGQQESPAADEAAVVPPQPEDTAAGSDPDDPSSPDEPDGKRPKQSDTVETLPGTAADNFPQEQDDTAAGKRDGADGSDAETPEAPTDGEPSPDEQESEAYPESKDFEFVYDPETKHFQVTFHITEDAEGDQTIELSKVLEEVDGYGQAEFDNWKETQDYRDLVSKGVSKINWTGDRFGDLKYIFDLKTGKASLYVEPGCTTVFDVSLANGSKHTYLYKNDSLVISTPDMKNDDKTGVVGFDGQELPSQYARSSIQLGYNKYGETGCMEHLADIAAEKYCNDTRAWANPSKVIAGMQKYLDENYGGSYEAYILDYFNGKSGSQYASSEELLRSNPEALKDLCGTKTISIGQTLTVASSTSYDNFYQNLLSFNVGSPEKMKEFLKKEGLTHGSWASEDEGELTIGQYMADKLDETDGAWAKADSYFQTLLASGLTAEQATWAAFTMATNIDGRLTGNDYQDTAWSWYASMVLHQADGTLHLTKTDEKGEVIGDDEGEGQTSFYLWKYETETDDSGKETEVPMYCTYVEPTYSTNDAGEQVLEKEGFYCWVKYDPAEDKLNYTITTTNGSLNIDYALLENMVYYLQEALAPEGYDPNPGIYVICDQKTYDDMVDSGAFDHVENPAADASGSVAGWLGSIVGGENLSINFINSKSAPVPDVPDDPGIPPKTPDDPTSPETPDTPPAQEEVSEAPVLPKTPDTPAPAVDISVHTLPQTGTGFWLSSMLLRFGTALLACGWFLTRRQRTAG